jgi:hypothetical protein
MNNLGNNGFELMGALTLVMALTELYRPKAEAAARDAIHAQDNLPANFDREKFVESCGAGLELNFMVIFMEKAKKLDSPTYVPIAIAGVFKRTDDISAFIAKKTKAFLENIPKEWDEYWLRAFAERLKDFLDVIDGDGEGT